MVQPGFMLGNQVPFQAGPQRKANVGVAVVEGMHEWTGAAGTHVAEKI